MHLPSGLPFADQPPARFPDGPPVRVPGRGPGPATRRVAVTGIGALSACGPDVATLRGALETGACGIRREDDAPWPQARVVGYEALAHFGVRELAMLDRTSQLALVAARAAMAQALLPRSTSDGPETPSGASRPVEAAQLHAADLDPSRCGVVYAAGLGHQTLDEGYEAFYRAGKTRLHPFLVPRGMPSAPASQLSMAFGLIGPSFATASACASSAHAIGLAGHLVRSGWLDLALTGGAEASLVPGMVCAWEGLRVLSGDTCRPFSLDRSGLVLGEGAAALVLEDWDRAVRRGVEPLAEWVGVGMSADAADITAPSADGAARAMAAALADAGLDASAVDYVNAHGTGTRLNDATEVAALRQVFGSRLQALPVSSSKGQFGHTLNAAGALEAVVSVLALQQGRLPASVGHRAPDPACAIDCVAEPGRRAALDHVLSNSFAFGGLNAALVFRRARSA